MKKLLTLFLSIVLVLSSFTLSVYALDSYADAKINSNLTTALANSSTKTTTAYITFSGIDDDEFMDYFKKEYPVDYEVYMYAKYDVTPPN